MDVQAQIDSYIAGQPEPKRAEMSALHRMILGVSPNCRLWFLDGRNGEGNVVTNPNVGYGLQVMTYASGETREFYRIGVSANTTGLSVYVMGLEDKNFLAAAYGDALGKAKVTGYCIRFRTLKDINTDVLEAMIARHMGQAA